MENRFSVKDFFLFILIGALILVVAGAMWQFDRQYDKLVDIERNVVTAERAGETGDGAERQGLRASRDEPGQPRDAIEARVRRQRGRVLRPRPPRDVVLECMPVGVLGGELSLATPPRPVIAWIRAVG